MDQTPEQTIVALAHASAHALARRDVEFFAQLLDEAFVYINANGEALSKQEYVQRYVAPPEAQWLSQALEEAQVRFSSAFLWRREPFEGEYVTTRVYVRDGDQWRCVSGHTSQRTQET
jgi:hypothetical protein